MASSELDWTVAQSYELDSTDETISDDEEKDSTDETISDGEEDAEISMDADSTEQTQDKFLDADHTDETQDKFLDADSTDGTTDKFADRKGAWAISKIPSSEIVVRTIAVDRSAPLAALPADSDAAYSQWLSNSGLAPSHH